MTTTYEAEIRVGCHALPSASIRIVVEEMHIRTPLAERGMGSDPLITIREVVEHLLPPRHHIATLRRVAESKIAKAEPAGG